ncbi:MFS transporter [Bosea sp. CS1GBMeth4]|uniref:MFS transporter n=1 Tax=Bosea sp. CS1GBMeth4 TaxID=1892849 RepID=UPI0016462EFB|nr:MFS transporter [Bosea sp. CS1GBMeth4]
MTPTCRLERVVAGQDRRGGVNRDLLAGFVLLYALIYAAFGVASPFWPHYFETRGVASEELGLLLALGTAVRLVSGPAAGRIADRRRARRMVLASCLGIAGLVAFGLATAGGLLPLLLFSLFHAAALAPTTTLADALASRAAVAPGDGRSRRFEYGWVRGTGSAAFIIGTLLAGQMVGAIGLTSIVLLHAGLLVVSAFAVLLVPDTPSDRRPAAQDPASPEGGFSALMRIAVFRRLLLVVALILGSHAMHDAFAVIRWTAAGIGPGTASLLWSLSVAAEVIVFFVVGPPLVARVGPAAAAAIAALAGLARWSIMALTADPLVLALVQPFHGATFALLHLACIRILTQSVPPELAATGQAVYAVASGAATALLTLAAGVLYARYGATAFFAMAALCGLALPLTRGLRSAGGS